MKTDALTRKKYKEIKKMGHSEMNEYIAMIYKKGYSEGKDSASVDLEKLREVMLSVKGIGKVKADKVIEILKGAQ